jgi:hypothetical protein
VKERNNLEELGLDRRNVFHLTAGCEQLRWSRGSVLAFGTQVRGIKPFLRRGCKAVGPMSLIYGM